VRGEGLGVPFGISHVEVVRITATPDGSQPPYRLREIGA
jgi:hypothetical protein